MSSGYHTTDYAVRNTKHVLRALRSYQIKAATKRRGQAARAAIDRFEALSGRRVSTRTVHRWLAAIKAYGGIEKVPPNGFGMLKSRPHDVNPTLRPIRDCLCKIEATASHLVKKCRMGNLTGTNAEAELSLIARDLDSVSSCVYAPPRSRLMAIRHRARRMGRLSIDRLYRLAEEPKIEESLADILARLEAVASQSAERPA